MNSPHLPDPGQKVQEENPHPLEVSVTDETKVPAPLAGKTLFAPMPRRPRIGTKERKTSTLSLPPKRVFQPSPFAVARRLVFWMFYIGMFFGRVAVAKMLRRGTAQGHARALREMLEGMGPTAIKVGQQLSVRADLLPFEYCDELTKMLDRVPAFEFEKATVLIERAVRAPLNEVFERIDPVPIGSASLSCVFQAKLRTGEAVALKVKRPGIAMQMTTDLKAICWLCIAAETVGVIRSGLTRNFRLELTRMLTEELDFALEARYTEIFRRVAKKHKYVSAPRVYPELSDNDVLVTEFIPGVFLNELLNALERRDTDELQKLIDRGFSPKKISKRMMNVFHWECFESLFFHADPHPANIIVRPDNTLVMIDFGSCGSVSSRMKRKLLSFNRHMATEDLNGMVQNTISMLEPLPHFDVDSFSIDLMNIYREIFIAHKSKYAPWYDKCSGAMWMRVIGLSQKYNLPMTLDTVRIFRASFMYDSIIYRLNPKLDPVKEFKKWAKSWDKKNRKKSENWVLDRVLGPLDSDFTRAAEISSIFEHAMDRIQNLLDRPSYNFGFTIGKVAYVFAILLKTLVVTGGSVLVISVVRTLYDYPSQSGVEAGAEFAKAVSWTLNNKFFLVCFTVYCVIAMRKILFRVQDVDVD